MTGISNWNTRNHHQTFWGGYRNDDIQSIKSIIDDRKKNGLSLTKSQKTWQSFCHAYYKHFNDGDREISRLNAARRTIGHTAGSWPDDADDLENVGNLLLNVIIREERWHNEPNDLQSFAHAHLDLPRGKMTSGKYTK